eukprot:CAMPEP_0204301244 /NCGR_PEP_ID=MMETSP0468-20130131/80021_1 /ASSEMBLY_ACC=CAM_ASM_000383 /TAXON_ID=2969 /ORGANISM="Oxyrrhis marina" /LENGTH=44 /DNA_ID= /DNA_START= /DNA_END= /DNA_ORIENTATION=
MSRPTGTWPRNPQPQETTEELYISNGMGFAGTRTLRPFLHWGHL